MDGVWPKTGGSVTLRHPAREVKLSTDGLSEYVVTAGRQAWVPSLRDEREADYSCPKEPLMGDFVRGDQGEVSMRALRTFAGLIPAVFLAVTVVTATSAEAQNPATFTSDIRPIMERSCWDCHGVEFQRSGLDLRTRDGALLGGSNGPAIVPGRAEESLLYRMVAGLDEPLMPRDGPSLTRAEIAAVRAWIDGGAHWDDGPTVAVAADATDELPSGAREAWAFQLPVGGTVPTAAGFEHPIDRFLEQTRRAQGLTAAPRANRRTLLRRAHLDLIGLPPTPEETAEFLADSRPDAWERVIERLLASPHYGERWGRHWLDVARYADSDGFEQDYDRPNAWRYRDYVISAFNRDKPFDRFIEEQIAGDELDWATDETRIATGFLRAGPRVHFREKDNPERRYEYLDDIVATLGRGVLGLTVQCARCHDHKFDPILQTDYYRLATSIFGYVETEYPLLPRAEGEAYRAKIEDIAERQRLLRAQVAEIEAPYSERLKIERLEREFPADVLRAVQKPESERTPGEKLLADQVLSLGVSRALVAQALTSEDAARRQTFIDRIAEVGQERPERPPMADIVTDGDYRFTPDGPGDEIIGCPECRVPPDEPGSYLHEGPGRYEVPTSHLLIRGDPFSLGPVMSPGFVKVATYGDPPTEISRPDGRTSGRRLALAEWLTSEGNPLTARVLVNRIWHHHFGRGIVATLDNFGAVGDPPTHPELLDWLAVEFASNGWSIKQMHRLMMTSEAYQMASAYEDAGNVVNDPENQSVWRFRTRRLETEILRDAIMVSSGGIDLTVGGPPVFPYVPEEILASQAHGRWDNQPDGPAVWRRSVYVYRRRSLVFPFFETFDLPDQGVTTAARNVSTVATQALTLLNNPFVLGQAALFAERVEREVPNDVAQQVDLAYHIALTRPPTGAEAAIGRQLVEEGSLVDLTHVMFNLSEFLYLR